MLGFIIFWKNQKLGTGEMVQWLRAPTVLKRSQVQFPVPTWWLTNTWNPSSKGIWSLLVFMSTKQRCGDRHACRPNICRDKKKINKTHERSNCNLSEFLIAHPSNCRLPVNRCSSNSSESWLCTGHTHKIYKHTPVTPTVLLYDIMVYISCGIPKLMLWIPRREK